MKAGTLCLRLTLELFCFMQACWWIQNKNRYAFLTHWFFMVYIVLCYNWGYNSYSRLLLGNTITDHTSRSPDLPNTATESVAFRIPPLDNKGNRQVCNKLSRLNNFCFHHILRFVKLDLVTLIKIPRGWRLNHVSETERRRKEREKRR